MIAERLDAQLLSRRGAASAVEVAERLLAVQAQDPRGFRLAVRARSAVATNEDLERSLDEGRLVVSWLNRGTLHLVRAEDYWQLFALTTPQLWTGNVRRLRQEGVDERQTERGVEILAESIESEPKTRAELRAALARSGVPTAGQALVHLLWAASLRGLLVRGPMKDGEQAFVSAARWLGPPTDVDRPESLAWLARRYLAGHGPADAADLAKWANIPLREARQGLAGLGEEAPLRTDGLYDLLVRSEPAPLPPPRLLGVFEPLLLGWTDRTPYVGPHTSKVLVGGMFKSFAFVDGRAVATWSWAKATVTLTLLEDVDAETIARLTDDAADVARFLGRPAPSVVCVRGG